MGTKTIRLDDDVYERLAAHKRDDETYSEVVDRLLGGGSLLDLTGIYTKADVDEIEEALAEKEERDRRRRRDAVERQE